MTRTSADPLDRGAPARRGRRRTVTAAAGVAVVGLALAGCSYLSPAQVVDRYAQADGTWAELRDPGTGAVVRLEDMLVVSSKPGAPGVLIGAVSSDAAEDLTVAITLIPSAPATSSDGGQVTPIPIKLVMVPAGGHVTFGPGNEKVDVPSVPAPPGAMVTLNAAVSSGEGVRFSAPVVRPQGDYEGVTPAPVPSTTSTTAETTETTAPEGSTTESPSVSTSGPETTTTS